MNFKRQTAYIALALSGLLLAANTAVAATATGTFPVIATVANNCSVSSTGVAFGTVNAGAAATNMANNIVVTCNKGVAITSLFIGNGANASGTQKRMIGGAEFLNYNIDVPTGAALTTCPVAGTNEWNATVGPAGATLTSLFAATGGPKNVSICASIPAGQYPTGAAYSDTITMTLTYN